MALTTRCPQCHAVFRVVADQLKLRGGLVRCGQCATVFDAINALSYIEDEQLKQALAPRAPVPPAPRPAAPIPLASAAAPAESPGPETAAALQSPIAPTLPSVAPTVARAEPVEWARLRRAAADSPLLLGADSTAPVDAEDLSSAPATSDVSDASDASINTAVGRMPASVHTEASASETERLPADELPHADADGARSAGESAPPTPAGNDDETVADGATAPDESGAAPPADRPELHPEVAANSGELAIHGVDPPTAGHEGANSHTDALPAPAEVGFLNSMAQARARRRTWLWGLGAALAAAVLAWQLAVALRAEILMRWPQAHPLLVRLCQPLGCQVEWPTQSALLAVLASDLQAVPGSSAFELDVTLRNRAPYPQALPAIELSLMDTHGQTIVRRVFTPAEYGAPPQGSLAPGADLAARVLIEVKGPAPAGFLVYPFYP